MNNTPASSAVRSASATAPTRQRVVDQIERFGLIIAWAITIAIFGALRPETFLSWPNFATILGSQAVLVVATLGLLVPLTAGDYDLSVASVLTLSSMTIAVLNVNHGLPIELAILTALGVGVLTGIVNGFFVIFFRIHSLIVTLGIGTFLHGITLWIGDSMTISGISSTLVNWVIVKRLLGIPLEFYYALLLCIVIWYVFTYTAVGRRLLFVGRQPRSIATQRHSRGSRPLGLPDRVESARIVRGGPICRHYRGSRSVIGHDISASGVRGVLSRRDQHIAGPLQPMGRDDSSVLSGDGHHRTLDTRREHLRPRPFLRRRVGDRGYTLAVGSRTRGALYMSLS